MKAQIKDLVCSAQAVHLDIALFLPEVFKISVKKRGALVQLDNTHSNVAQMHMEHHRDSALLAMHILRVTITLATEMLLVIVLTSSAEPIAQQENIDLVAMAQMRVCA